MIKYCVNNNALHINGFTVTRYVVHELHDYDNGRFRMRELCMCEFNSDAERIVEALQAQEKASVKDGEA